MTAALAAGVALAAGGLGGLGWVALKARGVSRSDLTPEAARAELRRLMAWNAAAVATAFLGLALMIVGGVMAG